MKEKFENKRLTGEINIRLDAKRVWNGDKATVVEAIRRVAESYKRQGYVLTLRQLYYQLVKANTIPNHDKVYKKLGSIKDDTVYSGLVDWSCFEDRGRIPHRSYFEYSVEDALQRTVDSFRLDRQLHQPNHIEVWSEKDAISSILKRATDPRTIHLVVNKGYSSSTAMYQAYRRFLEAMNNGQKVVILYFGDHDPSGLDMVRDIEDRILFMLSHGELFDEYMSEAVVSHWNKMEYTVNDCADLGEAYEDVPDLIHKESEKLEELFAAAQRRIFIRDRGMFKVVHVGLTMDQIRHFNPPPNPAKITDSRADKYIDEYGPESWEVDALSPADMVEIITEAINDYTDEDIFNETLSDEKAEKGKIIEMIKNLKGREDLEEDEEEDDEE